MSGEESNQVINQLKREISCLKTELLYFKLLSNCYQKYFDYFNEINVNIDSNEEILDLKNRIKALKEAQNSCFISAEMLNKNQLNQYPLILGNELKNNSQEFIQISTETEITETNHRLRAKEVFTQTEVNRNESNKTDETIALKKEILKLKEDIKILQFSNEKTCFVSLKQLKENVFKHKSREVFEQNLRTDFTQTYVETTHISTQIEIAEKSDELSSEEVSDNDSEGIDCDINYTNLSNDETIDGIIDENDEQNSVERKNSIESTENAMKLNIKNEIQSEDNEEEVQNESQIRIVNIRSLRNYKKREHNSINGESEDNGIQCNDNLDTDCELRLNDDKLNHLSDVVTQCKESDGKQIGRKFKCCADGCRYIAKTNFDLERHKSRIHSKVKPFVCSIEGCNKRFGFKLDLVRHEKYHKILRNGNQIRDNEEEILNESQTQIGNLRSKRKCKTTSFIFGSEDNDNESNDISDIDCVSNTKTVHNITELKPYKYICEHIGCGKQFKTIPSLNIHENIHLGGKYKCKWKDCTAVFSAKRYLVSHMNKHSDKFLCTHEGCHFRGSDSSELKLHQTSHSEDRPLICLINDCNKRFKREAQLRNHQLRVHPQEFDDIPWFECSQNECNFKTKSKPVFTTHERQHTRPYVCTQCQKCFASAEGLNKHLPTHSSELKVRCDWPGCDRLFSLKKKLKEHLNSHTHEIKHSCHWPNCDKTFTTKGALSSHVMRHKGKNRYRCSNCDYMTTNTIRYKNHLKKHEIQTQETEK